MATSRQGSSRSDDSNQARTGQQGRNPNQGSNLRSQDRDPQGRFEGGQGGRPSGQIGKTSAAGEKPRRGMEEEE